jgi:hypothetical protein
MLRVFRRETPAAFFSVLWRLIAKGDEPIITDA